MHCHHVIGRGISLPNLSVRERPKVQLPFDVVVNVLQVGPGAVQCNMPREGDLGIDLHGAWPKGPHLRSDHIQRVAHQEQGLVFEVLFQKPREQGIASHVFEQQLLACSDWWALARDDVQALCMRPEIIASR